MWAKADMQLYELVAKELADHQGMKRFITNMNHNQDLMKSMFMRFWLTDASLAIYTVVQEELG